MSNGTPKIESIELPLPEFPKRPERCPGDCITAPQTTSVIIADYVDRFEQEWRAYANELHRAANEEISRLKTENQSLLTSLETNNALGKKAITDFFTAKKLLVETQTAMREADARISKVLAELEPIITFVRVDAPDNYMTVGGGEAVPKN